MTQSARVIGIQYPPVNFAAPRIEPAECTVQAGSHGLTDFGQLNFGMAREEFLSNYFERQWLLSRGAHRDSKFSWSDVDELLYRIEPVAPYMQLFQDGEVPYERYVDDSVEHGRTRRRMNKAIFYDSLSRGATLVLNRLEEHSLAAKRLCTEVGRFAGHPTLGNAYLSFGGNGTFGKHWDTHDVFVVQLLGKKRWQVFAPTLPLPLSHQTCAPFRGQCSRQPVLDVQLNAGDVLYLPRGWWHQAIPCNSGSFHLSVGAYPPTAIDYLQWVNQQSLAALPAARVGISGAEDQALDAESILKSVTEAMRHSSSLPAYRQSLLEREQGRSEFTLALLLESSESILAGDAYVALNNCYAQTDTHSSLLNAITKSNRHAPQFDDLHKALIGYLATVTTTRVQTVCERIASASASRIGVALLDLARCDVVNLWRA